ncbi:MAG: GlxA family transcriptional regulator, partial [Halioglobus sp.]
MHTAAALLYPQALATSLTLPMEILQAASQMKSVVTRNQDRSQDHSQDRSHHRNQNRRDEAKVAFLLAAPSRRMVTLDSGITLKPTATLESLPSLDLLIIPAIWRNPLTVLRDSEPLLRLLQTLAERGTRLCSVGTGSFLLAEAGLLANKPATTHWNYFEQFSRRYPNVDLKNKHLITQTDNIYCVGSVNSIADLMVHIVEEWFGSQIARAIENQFSPEIRLRFNGAAYQDEADSSHHDEDIVRAQQWMQRNLASPIAMADLAEALHWNTRTLNRRFKAATNMTPLGYLQSLRISTAKELLRHSNLAIGEIALQVGLQDISYFSQL